VLVREGDPDGNPWGVSFMTMFHMANDSHLFHTRDELEAEGWQLDGNVFVRGRERMLPLYEAKMLHHYDHRWATYEPSGATREVTLEEKQDPNFVVLPRYWVADKEVEAKLAGRWDHPWLLGWRDITNTTNERTIISAFLPRFAVNHKLPLVLVPDVPELLVANWTSIAFDYVTRQKIGGTSMTYFYLKQLPVLPPSDYESPALWDRHKRMTAWIRSRLLELAFSAHDLTALATDLGGETPPFHWNPERRALLRAELDAAYFHLYGVDRDDVDYILDTFPIVRRKDEARYGEYRTKRLILEIYDAMAKAIDTGEYYQSVLDPPPGDGPRHLESPK
jgi:hypothetical protein